MLSLRPFASWDDRCFRDSRRGRIVHVRVFTGEGAALSLPKGVLRQFVGGGGGETHRPRVAYLPPRLVPYLRHLRAVCVGGETG